jgi:hypothetical protein
MRPQPNSQYTPAEILSDRLKHALVFSRSTVEALEGAREALEQLLAENEALSRREAGDDG